MPTFLEIQNEIKRRLRETAPDAVRTSVKWAINEAQTEISRKIRAWFLEQDFSVTLSAGASSVYLPTDFVKEIYVLCGTKKLTQIKQRHYRVNQSNEAQDSGEPDYYWLGTPNRLAYYSTGNVKVVPGTCAVTAGSSSPSYPSDIAGRLFRLQSSGDIYEIAARFSASQLTLLTPYAGTTSAANQKYQLDPPPRLSLQFDKAALTACTIAIHYYRKLPSLLGDNDFPVIPIEFQNALTEGGFYYALSDSQASGDSVERANLRWQEKLAQIQAECEESGDLEQEITMPDFRAYRKDY